MGQDDVDRRQPVEDDQPRRLGMPLLPDRAPPLTRERARTAILAKIAALQAAGHMVSMTGDIPGLWRVDNGPEITTNQLIGWTV